MTHKLKIEHLLNWIEAKIQTDIMYLLKGGSWLLLGRIFIYSIYFLKLVILTRLLSPEIYGTYNYIISVIIIFSVFSLPEMETALVKSIANQKDGTLEMAGKTKFKWSLLASLSFFGFGLWYFFRHEALIGSAFLFAALLFPFAYSFIGFSFYWQGRKRFDMRIKYEITAEIISALSMIVAVFFTSNIAFIIFVNLFSQAAANVYLFLKTAKAKRNNDKDLPSIHFGKSLTAINSINLISSYIDKTILWSFFGAVPVAVYSIAYFPIYRLQGLFPIVPLALPKLGQKNIRDNDVKNQILEKFKKLFIFFIPLTIATVALSSLFFKIFFPKYLESIPYFQALSVLLLLAPFSLLNTALVTEMKKKELFVLNVVSPIIKIFLFFILAPVWGIWGIVVSTIGTQFLNCGLTYYFFKKI